MVHGLCDPSENIILNEGKALISSSFVKIRLCVYVCVESNQGEGKTRARRNQSKVMEIKDFISCIIPSIVVFIIEGLRPSLMEFGR